MTKVKVCGVTNLEDALSIAEAGADAIGFIFANSPRQIMPRTAKEISQKLPPFIVRIGVFVNSDVKSINDISDFCKLDMVQLHGAEAPEYCLKLKKRIIKAFRVKDEQTLSAIPNYLSDAYLLDSYSKDAPGGTGKTFDWNLAIKAKEFLKPIILAGGLNPENIEEAIQTVKPYGVDLNSGFEVSPGVKDIKKISEAIKKISLLN